MVSRQQRRVTTQETNRFDPVKRLFSQTALWNHPVTPVMGNPLYSATPYPLLRFSPRR